MQLTAQKRDILGKKVASLRAKGLIPAELYGHDVPNMHLVVSVKEFTKVLKQAGESTVVALAVQNEPAPFNVLIHDLEEDALKGTIKHVDFYVVRMDEKITIGVPLEFIGVSPAVKEKQGILIKAMHEIKVEALPADLPHSLSVDVSSLSDIGSSIYVKDISLPKGVKVLVDDDTVVATVTEQAKEEEPVVSPVDVTAVKVEGEEKRAQSAAAKADEEAK